MRRPPAAVRRGGRTSCRAPAMSAAHVTTEASKRRSERTRQDIQVMANTIAEPAEKASRRQSRLRRAPKNRRACSSSVVAPAARATGGCPRTAGGRNRWTPHLLPGHVPAKRPAAEPCLAECIACAVAHGTQFRRSRIDMARNEGEGGMPQDRLLPRSLAGTRQDRRSQSSA